MCLGCDPEIETSRGGPRRCHAKRGRSRTRCRGTPVSRDVRGGWTREVGLDGGSQGCGRWRERPCSSRPGPRPRRSCPCIHHHSAEQSPRPADTARSPTPTHKDEPHRGRCAWNRGTEHFPARHPRSGLHVGIRPDDPFHPRTQSNARVSGPRIRSRGLPHGFRDPSPANVRGRPDHNYPVSLESHRDLPAMRPTLRPTPLQR